MFNCDAPRKNKQSVLEDQCRQTPLRTKIVLNQYSYKTLYERIGRKYDLFKVAWPMLTHITGQDNGI